MERIQKALSAAGLAGRRAVEQMILDGRITVNGELITSLPCFVDLAKDDIRVDDKPIRKKPPRLTHLLLNKPRGVVCTLRDPQGRPRAVDLLPAASRVQCVAPLDAEATGLVIITNDGDLAQHMTHRRYGVEKTYTVEVEGRLDAVGVEKLKRGVFLDGRRTSGAKLKVLRHGPPRSLLEMRLVETHSRQVRRMLAAIGHTVRRLRRTAIGPITEKGLKIGHYRAMTEREVAALSKE